MGGTTPVLWSSDLDVQWRVLADLLLALVLCTVIGIERELAAKSAGLRTHALVGVGSAAFMLISKYGFGDLIAVDHISLDPSRVAAQMADQAGSWRRACAVARRPAHAARPEHRRRRRRPCRRPRCRRGPPHA